MPIIVDHSPVRAGAELAIRSGRQAASERDREAMRLDQQVKLQEQQERRLQAQQRIDEAFRTAEMRLRETQEQRLARAQEIDSKRLELDTQWRTFQIEIGRMDAEQQASLFSMRLQELDARMSANRTVNSAILQNALDEADRMVEAEAIRTPGITPDQSQAKLTRYQLSRLQAIAHHATPEEFAGYVSLLRLGAPEGEQFLAQARREAGQVRLDQRQLAIEERIKNNEALASRLTQSAGTLVADGVDVEGDTSYTRVTNEIRRIEKENQRLRMAAQTERMIGVHAPLGGVTTMAEQDALLGRPAGYTEKQLTLAVLDRFMAEEGIDETKKAAVLRSPDFQAYLKATVFELGYEDFSIDDLKQGTQQRPEPWGTQGAMAR